MSIFLTLRSINVSRDLAHLHFAFDRFNPLHALTSKQLNDGEMSVNGSNDEFAMCRNRLNEWRTLKVKMLGEEVFDITERAWAAGLFDGEGSVGVKTRGDTYCHLGQVSDDVINLVRFLDAVDVGQISPPEESTVGNARPMRTWYVSSQKDIQKVCDRIGPFLNPAKLNGLQLNRDAHALSKRGFNAAISKGIVSSIENNKPLPKGTFVREVPPRKRRDQD